MLSLFDLQDLIGTSFFDGDVSLAGMCMYVVVLLVLFALTRKTQQTLIIALPTTFIFNVLGVLSTDMMILLIIVTVLALAFTARNAWRS